MAKYNKTKFYWLMLQEDFFDEDTIQWLEDQPNGKEYSLFYLKLCLKSLKTNGVLIRQVGNVLIPYDNEKLAELTRTNVDTVVIAMELLKKIGLVKVLETGEIYLHQLQNMIGSKSIGAFKKAQQRMIGGQKVDKCPPNIEQELKLDSSYYSSYKYINIKDAFEKIFGREITELEEEFFDEWKKLFSEDIIIYAIKIAEINEVRKVGYIKGILSNWKKANFKTLEEIKKSEINFTNQKSDKESEKILETFEDYDWFDDEKEKLEE